MLLAEYLCQIAVLLSVCAAMDRGIATLERMSQGKKTETDADKAAAAARRAQATKTVQGWVSAFKARKQGARKQTTKKKK